MTVLVGLAGFRLPIAAGVTATLPTGHGSFAAFTDTITSAARCLRTPADATRLVDEVVQDAAHAGAVWVEPSVWPGLFGGRLGTDADVLDILLAAGHAAARRYNVGFSLVVAANRDRGPGPAHALARLAASRSSDGVVGFGLDGDEARAPAHLFTEAFKIVRSAGLAAGRTPRRRTHRSTRRSRSPRPAQRRSHHARRPSHRRRPTDRSPGRRRHPAGHLSDRQRDALGRTVDRAAPPTGPARAGSVLQLR